MQSYSDNALLVMTNKQKEFKQILEKSSTGHTIHKITDIINQKWYKRKIKLQLRINIKNVKLS